MHVFKKFSPNRKLVIPMLLKRKKKKEKIILSLINLIKVNGPVKKSKYLRHHGRLFVFKSQNNNYIIIINSEMYQRSHKSPFV